MMKKTIMFLCAVSLVFGIVGMASATTMYEHVYNPVDVFLIAYNSSYDSITGWVDIAPKGYDENTQSVTEAYLDLYLYGNGDWSDEDGQLLVSTNNILETSIPDPNKYQTIPVDDGLSWLQDGNTRFTLEATVGDFYFDKAIFKAYATDPPATSHTPEPATMLLVGSGLVGFAGFRKKFKKV